MVSSNSFLAITCKLPILVLSCFSCKCSSNRCVGMGHFMFFYLPIHSAKKSQQSRHSMSYITHKMCCHQASYLRYGPKWANILIINFRKTSVKTVQYYFFHQIIANLKPWNTSVIGIKTVNQNQLPSILLNFKLISCNIT